MEAVVTTHGGTLILHIQIQDPLLEVEDELGALRH